MEIKCELCGEKVVVAEDLVPGQHVRCPFCGGKFSYAERPKEITEDDLREAIAVCRKNDEWNKYYKNAPAGAKLYIALVFYGRVFASTLDKKAFVKAFKEIGPELKECDLRYLLQHEDDEAMREYLSDRLAASGDGLEGERLGGAAPKARQSVGAEAMSSAGVAQPVTVWKFKKEAHVETRGTTKRTRRTNRSGAIAVLVAAAAVIFIGVITYSVLKEPRPKEIPNDVSLRVKDAQQRLANKRNELRTLIGEKRSRITRFGAEMEEAQQQPKADRQRLADELEKIGAENNFRAGEAKAKGRVRFNKAELTLAIFKSKVFVGLYRRYVGTDVTTVVADCRRCVKDAIGGRMAFTQQEMDAVDRAAELRLQKVLGEVDGAIRERVVDLKSKRAE